LQTLSELGEAVAQRRKLLGLKQADVAVAAGAEFGARKLLSVLAVLNAELDIVSTESGCAGDLDSLRLERALAKNRAV
jgi:transcriptional regulator with XRE-family HTH domain